MMRWSGFVLYIGFPAELIATELHVHILLQIFYNFLVSFVVIFRPSSLHSITFWRQNLLTKE